MSVESEQATGRKGDSHRGAVFRGCTSGPLGDGRALVAKAVKILGDKDMKSSRSSALRGAVDGLRDSRTVFDKCV
jgi:hypothetical protein